MTARLLFSVRLRPQTHIATGAVMHTIGGVKMAYPDQLRIVQFDPEFVIYLYYCDSLGHEMSDTQHDSVESAMEQAEREFGVKRDEWLPA